MTLLIVPLLCVLLVIAAIKAKQAALSGAKVALIAAAGVLCSPAVTFAILAWGFSNFG